MVAPGVRPAAALFAAVFVVHGLSAADTRPPELARNLQKKYAAIKDFSADFVHVYAGGVLKKQLSERGHMLIKKPGKMKWEYTVPEPKLFVSDGVKMYSYLPHDKQVIVGSVPPGDQASTPMLFLTGKGDLKDLRRHLLCLDAQTGTVAWQKDVPVELPETDWNQYIKEHGYASGTPATDGERVYVFLAIVGLVTADAQGGKSSFSFTKLKENVGLADKDFAFKIPRGVDVVTDGSRR